MANVTPIVYDDITKEHKAANVGDNISPAFNAIDPALGNLLQNKLDAGLGVFANDLVSPQPDNRLTVNTDGKLFAADTELVSKQEGNYVRYGDDKGVYLDGNDILANGVPGNLLHLDPNDKKLVLTKEDLENAGIGGGGSDLKPDVDQLKVDVRELRTEYNTVSRQVERNTDAINDLKDMKTDVNTLRRDVDNNTRDITTIKSDIADLPTMRRNIETNADDIADLKRDLQDMIIVSTDRGNVITEGRDEGAYLSADDIITVVEDAGITKVNVRDLINTNDPLLSTQGDKIISSLALQYNSATGRIDIMGVHGQSITHAVIPTSVTVLKSVELVDNPSGQPAGTYIHFQFELSDGSTTDMYLNVNKLVQFYVAGDGIQIDSDDKISVEPTRIAEIVTDAINDGTINLVSTDANNLIDVGSDGRPFIDPADLPSGISDDTGNALTLGSDDKPFLPLDYGTL